VSISVDLSLAIDICLTVVSTTDIMSTGDNCCTGKSSVMVATGGDKSSISSSDCVPATG